MLVATVAAVLLGVLLVYKLAFYIAPFIIAFLISSLLEPLIRFIVRNTKLSRKVVAPVTLLFFMLCFGVLVTLAIIRLVDEIKSISKILPNFLTDLYTNSIVLINKAEEIYEWLPKEIADNIETIIANLTNSVMNIANTLVNAIVKGAFATAISIPEALIFTLITILSTYFLTSDRDRISGYFKTHFPDSWVSRFSNLRNEMFTALFGYLRAQLIIMSITFTELFIGLSVIRVKYALVLAFLIGIVDALPVLGTGTFLIPWSIYNFLIGNIRMGVSIIVLYAIILIVRQMIEPKILGHQIGVYPLLTLMAMYAGLKLFGVAGLILGPITFLLIRNILSGIYKKRSIKDILNKSGPQGNNINGDKT